LANKDTTTINERSEFLIWIWPTRSPQLSDLQPPISVCLIPTVVRTTTKEKRLIIDIMALRQSYERRELTEVRWIHGDDNITDAFTKDTPNKALERFVSNNETTIWVEGWVSR
jgi:hypothetical protein